MSDYYPVQKDKLLKQHDDMAKIALIVLERRYGKALAEQYVPEFRSAFEAIIPELPYIGGDANRMTETITKIASPLAIYRVLKQHGVDVATIGDIVYETAKTYVQQYPKIMRKMMGWYFLSGMSKRKLEQAAEISQQSTYEDDFVYEVVEGEDIIWGINYLECGLVKWFAKLGAQEFAPYMCRLDWVMYEALEINLSRTQTIAQGATHCDFRFNR